MIIFDRASTLIHGWIMAALDGPLQFLSFLRKNAETCKAENQRELKDPAT